MAAEGEVQNAANGRSGAVAPPEDETLPVETPGGQREEIDWEDRWRRAVADLANVRKRHYRELDGARDQERAAIAGEWLPVLDNLDRALEHADADPAGILEGVRAVRDQAVALLSRLGYERFEDVGVPFDPSRHEVVSVVDDSDTEPGTVLTVLRPGYGDVGRQLRPVGVVVSRRPG
ncbi:MAG: putative GrpE heat shock protein [Pseudonocardiales bacterium]|nr:putative GrpE heat shock protein [Pseudonocardiales bacterium]